MTLKQRRLLFYCFILLFIIVVPIVLIYATGRTVNWQRLEFQKTATLVIDSSPDKATVYLNGRSPGNLADRLFSPSDITTKAKLSGIVPGTYTLRLESLGYLPWEEQITLRPGEVFNTGSIRLFAQTKPEFITELASNSVTSANGDSIASLEGQALRIYHLPEATSQDIQLPTKPVRSELAWSTDGERLLIGHDTVIDRDGKTRSDVRTALIDAKLVRWEQDSQTIYFVANKRLSRVDSATGAVTVLRDLSDFNSVLDLYVSSGHIFLVTTVADRTELVILSDNSLANDSRSQLKNGPYHFINTNQDAPALADETRHDLYLIERPLPFMFAYRLTLVTQDFRLGSWNGSELVYATPFELRRWRPDENESLLARWSEPVTAVRRLPGGNQVLFATATTIQVLPSDEQAFRPTVRLAGATLINGFSSVTETAIFFIGTVNGQTGLFRLAI